MRTSKSLIRGGRLDVTPKGALDELIARIGAAHGAPIVIADQELRDWPAAAVAAMKAAGLLTKAGDASSIVCPGCEQQCTMPVHVLPAETAPEAFVVCDQRSDINRVPISLEALKGQQASAEAFAGCVTRLLGLRRPVTSERHSNRWELGVLKGEKHSGHLVLVIEGELTLKLAGHSVAVADVLRIRNSKIVLDKGALDGFADSPTLGGGDDDSATARRSRLQARVEAVRATGNKRFLVTVAEEERISLPRLKQILARRPIPGSRRGR